MIELAVGSEIPGEVRYETEWWHRQHDLLPGIMCRRGHRPLACDKGLVMAAGEGVLTGNRSVVRSSK